VTSFNIFTKYELDKVGDFINAVVEHNGKGVGKFIGGVFTPIKIH